MRDDSGGFEGAPEYGSSTESMLWEIFKAFLATGIMNPSRSSGLEESIGEKEGKKLILY